MNPADPTHKTRAPAAPVHARPVPTWPGPGNRPGSDVRDSASPVSKQKRRKPFTL
jgi:hypothetical protein